MIDRDKLIAEGLRAAACRLGNHEALPDATQLALAIVDGGHVKSEELCEAIGSKNWVIVRRTRGIVARYGENVVCLSPRRYDEAEMRALLKRAGVRADDSEGASAARFRREHKG